jgi:uncharacterized protein YjbI with pentapeptide repeats
MRAASGRDAHQCAASGATLNGAQLTGATLDDAQLQGATLDGAQLQGATLDEARLQGARLVGAQLQVGSIDGADLEGVSLAGAELQGASLQLAFLEATDLSGAWLWRTNEPAGSLATRTSVRLSGASLESSWRDTSGEERTWDDAAYQRLRKNLEDPTTGFVTDRIERLDCASSALAPCDSNVPPPSDATEWRKALEAASVGDGAYAAALAGVLKALVCSGEDDAIYAVRGLGFQGRLQAAGTTAFDLIGDLTNKENKDCPVAAALTDADRANLLRIKQRIEEDQPKQKPTPPEVPPSP